MNTKLRSVINSNAQFWKFINETIDMTQPSASALVELLATVHLESLKGFDIVTDYQVSCESATEGTFKLILHIANKPNPVPTDFIQQQFNYPDLNEVKIVMPDLIKVHKR